MNTKIFPRHHKQPAILPLSLAMMLTSFEPDDTACCPECGSDADMVSYEPRFIRYRCNACGLSFNEPYVKEMES
jgi:transposase-like protein